MYIERIFDAAIFHCVSSLVNLKLCTVVKEEFFPETHFRIDFVGMKQTIQRESVPRMIYNKKRGSDMKAERIHVISLLDTIPTITSLLYTD